MQTQRSLIFLLLTVPLLGGCAAVLLAQGAVMYNYLAPGDSEVVLAEPVGGQSNLAAMQKVSSIATSDELTRDYLAESGLFDRVVLTDRSPNTNQQAADTARDNNVDAFLFSDQTGANAEQGGLWQRGTVIYGAVRLTLVNQAGEEVYKQAVALQQKSNSVENFSQREIQNALAEVAIADIKTAQQMAAGEMSAASEKKEEKEEGWFSRMNPLD